MTVVQLAPPSLYGQVADDVASRIASGALKPGDILPTETAMCTEYGVSRITVRRALAELVGRRLVTRKAGVGSFIAGRPDVLREFHLTGVLEDKREFPSRTLLNQAEPAGAEVARALQLPPGTRVRHIRTLVHRDGTAMTVADAYTADSPDRRVKEEDYCSRNQCHQHPGGFQQRSGRRWHRPLSPGLRDPR